MRDPYDVLGVSKNASEAEIKKAFRSLAKKHHPDTKGGDPAAQKKFQEISGAYDIVGDKEKRAKYDAGQIDAQGNPKGFDPRAHGFEGGFPFGAGGGGGRGPGDFHFTWTNQGPKGGQGGGPGGGFNAEDIFADLFSGFGGRGGQRRQQAQPQPGQDFEVQTTVGFEEAAAGGTRRVVLPNGEQIDVKIPPGLKDGQQIRLRGRGGAGRAGGPPGDVLIQVTVAPHPYFTRDGHDLKVDLPVTLKEAVLGGKVPVRTLSGTVALSIPPGSNSGKVLRLKGKGIPASGQERTGDLYVRLIVTLPEGEDKELKSFIEKWGADYDPRKK
ncbi:DnaJ-class molecular chaperone [Rhizomicrobium palustre]|uniref:DnaJ-class molecular chaperone n=1 Tax=Rhizomicrobium palustre TaxID=189966 RepID=A0A846N1U8_9PROT|nr:DnaJ C-terminal domain-containing protein [Rhizomicrobium palustre]NIK89281.1 DnaJ-class molecular chaperone [Rhizomicrobium palustre]